MATNDTYEWPTDGFGGRRSTIDLLGDPDYDNADLLIDPEVFANRVIDPERYPDYYK